MRLCAMRYSHGAWGIDTQISLLQDFVSLVSEYIHGVANDEAELGNVRSTAAKAWNCLKRSAKAGPRRTVRCVRRMVIVTCSDGCKG